MAKGHQVSQFYLRRYYDCYIIYKLDSFNTYRVFNSYCNKYLIKKL